MDKYDWYWWLNKGNFFCSSNGTYVNKVLLMKVWTCERVCMTDMLTDVGVYVRVASAPQALFSYGEELQVQKKDTRY